MSVGGKGPGKLLVANRGEIAVRILRAAIELSIPTVAICSEDDTTSLHTRIADEVVMLHGTGAAAYLDAAQIVEHALGHGCTLVHPGYGFLAENSDFAAHCEDNGLTFVGPSVMTLAVFGDKVAARNLAIRCGVTVAPATPSAATLDEARAFLDGLGPGAEVMVKAVAGGGGRGIRVVRSPLELDDAYQRCRSEALAAFGNGAVYIEQRVARARHIEVQIIGDGFGQVSHLGERDCTIQRRHQKLLEITPSPWLDGATRQELLDAAVTMAEAVEFRSLGTFEFLLDVDRPGSFSFIECNARLQVEHTITEAVTGIDLVQAQLRLAAEAASLDDLGLEQRSIVLHGTAAQARINTETMGGDGTANASGGTLTAFDPPAGPGVRVDTAGYTGDRTNPRYDSLLAKVIAYSTGGFGACLDRLYRALCEFRIEGVSTNLSFLQNVVVHDDVVAGRTLTTFVDDHIAELTDQTIVHPRRFFAGEAAPAAALDSDATGLRIVAPMQGTIVTIDVVVGDVVRPHQQVAVMEAMKMEHVIAAPVSGIVIGVAVSPGDTVFVGASLIQLDERIDMAAQRDPVAPVDLDRVRPDLAQVIDRQAMTTDAARPDTMARRHEAGRRSARENVEDLCDAGSYVEYGSLTIAAQRRRRSVQDLIERTPADGMLAGIGRVNGDLFDDQRSRCAVMSYDYTVLAGTQGLQNHRKKDRLFELAERLKLPVVFFTEGGGGRPGDTDGLGVAGLDCMAFALFAGLSALVPLVGINAGYCFAGNAAILGCCDVIIATKDSNIGMGGPAMIEGGGLGVYHPNDVGPMEVQTANGVVDIVVDDEAAAVRMAKQYLSYFQGSVDNWQCADQRLLRHAIPENRLRVYDVRHVITTLADTGWVLELRRPFGPGMITALARIEGRPIGIIANDPNHLAGAIDSDGADKAARFMQVCDAHDIAILFLCDTPGMMVGPAVEQTALVRHCSRMFVTAASLTVPFFTMVLRKGYGLGAQAMAGGSFKAPIFTVAWPTGEFGGMGLEGAVRLGYRKELAALDDPNERQALYDAMVARMYEHGKALNTASHFEIDDVIDPADSRRLVSEALTWAPEPPPRLGKKRPCIDTW